MKTSLTGLELLLALTDRIKNILKPQKTEDCYTTVFSAFLFNLLSRGQCNTNLTCLGFYV